MTEPARAPDVERARRALRWAVDVGTRDPRGLDDAPERPDPVDLRLLSLEDVRPALDTVLVGRHAEAGLDALERCGVLDVWLPEVAGLVGFGDGEWRHKDVWKHTKQVVRQSVPRLEVRWSALLHDIGKPRTRTIDPQTGEVHFFGHAEVGARMFARRIRDRLGLDGSLGDRVHFLILHHLRASQYDASWSDSAVRRFAREMGDGLEDLLCLSRADITTKRPARRKRGLEQIAELAERIRRIQERDARVPPLPKGLGTALSNALGVPPSKQLGEIRNRIERLCDEGVLESRREIDYYVAWALTHREQLGLVDS
ncbi:MAG: HDIG domain-containing protein [Myxococcota bacterium]|nr:HDIG domain-containing protein [Myxococcota bacterium]MDW8363514.1 HDIG domain-containing protein [Myxococcales bacterium]